MSWEEMGSEHRPCPCRRGHYSVVRHSDDWGRHDEHWTMDCPQCRERYDLYETSFNRKGLWETFSGWVPKPLLEELAALGRELEAAKQDLAAYLVKHYETRWVAHFKGKTRGAIWAELTRDGQQYPSLGTFYRHVRDSGLTEVLQTYLGYRDVGIVVRVLGLSDPEPDRQVNGIAVLEHNIEQKEKEARRCAVS